MLTLSSMSWRTGGERGFSLIEILATVGIAGVVAAMAVPSTARTLGDMRLRGDARAIHNMVSVAKMRAAAHFTRERLYVDLSTESFFLQYWDRTAETWITDGGATRLSTGIDFGFNGLSSPPPSTQNTIGQAAACKDDSKTDIANTACVVFNSRGIPVDVNGDPTGNTAFYVTDHATGVYAVTLSATPLIRLWWTAASSAHWIHK